VPDLDPLDPLVSVVDLFPGRSKRWVADTCRAGRIPRAVRIGRTWMIRRRDFEAWLAGTSSSPAQPPSVEDAISVLRRHGVAA
jgi:hypothetical protein